jgi:hypothetical protein
MASIYKKGRDKSKKRATYWIDYVEHDPETGVDYRTTAKGFTDKGKTEQLAAKLEYEAHQRRTGLDQARILAGLSCQHIVSDSVVPDGPDGSRVDTREHAEGEDEEAATHDEPSPSDTEGRKKAPPESGGAEWRRRESNPRPVVTEPKPLRA